MLVVQVFLWLIAYSFFGWAYESALRSVTGRKSVNSGLLTGPICPIYGFGALLVILALYRRTDNLLIIFFFSMILTCSVEYITSLILEKLFHAKWWDYSHMRFNFQGRVSLIGAAAFGVLSVILIKYIHPFISGRIRLLPQAVQIFSASVLFAVLFIDTYLNVHSLLRLDGRLKEIHIAFNGFLEEYAKKSEGIKTALIEKSGEIKTALIVRFEESEFYSERIKKLVLLNRVQMKRIARAFPKFKHINYDEAWQRLKSILLEVGKK